MLFLNIIQHSGRVSQLNQVQSASQFDFDSIQDQTFLIKQHNTKENLFCGPLVIISSYDHYNFISEIIQPCLAFKNEPTEISIRRKHNNYRVQGPVSYSQITNFTNSVSSFFCFFFLNSIVGGGDLNPGCLIWKTLGDANQLSYKAANKQFLLGKHFVITTTTLHIVLSQYSQDLPVVQNINYGHTYIDLSSVP